MATLSPTGGLFAPTSSFENTTTPAIFPGNSSTSSPTVVSEDGFTFTPTFPDDSGGFNGIQNFQGQINSPSTASCEGSLHVAKFVVQAIAAGTYELSISSVQCTSLNVYVAGQCVTGLGSGGIVPVTVSSSVVPTSLTVEVGSTGDQCVNKVTSLLVTNPVFNPFDLSGGLHNTTAFIAIFATVGAFVVLFCLGWLAIVQNNRNRQRAEDAMSFSPEVAKGNNSSQISSRACCCLWFGGSPANRLLSHCYAVWLCTGFIFISTWGAYWSSASYAGSLLVSALAFFVHDYAKKSGSNLPTTMHAVSRQRTMFQVLFAVGGVICAANAAVALAQSGQIAQFFADYGAAYDKITSLNGVLYQSFIKVILFMTFGFCSVIPDLVICAVCISLARTLSQARVRNAAGIDLLDDDPALLSRLQKRHVMVSFHVDTSADFADAIYSSLQEKGVPCWISTRSIPPGVEWRSMIQGAVEQASHFIMLINNEWLDSGECQFEYKIAQRLNTRMKQPEMIPIIFPQTKRRMGSGTLLGITANYNCLFVDNPTSEEVERVVSEALASAPLPKIQQVSSQISQVAATRAKNAVPTGVVVVQSYPSVSSSPLKQDNPGNFNLREWLKSVGVSSVDAISETLEREGFGSPEGLKMLSTVSVADLRFILQVGQAADAVRIKQRAEKDFS